MPSTSAPKHSALGFRIYRDRRRPLLSGFGAGEPFVGSTKNSESGTERVRHRELSDPGVADAGARRSAGRAGVAVVSSRELDEQAGSVGASGCSGRISNGTNETGVGSGGDRSCRRGGCAL